MGLYYSDKNAGFYDTNVHTTLPDDAVEITDAEWRDLLTQLESGKEIRKGANGKPITITPTPAEILAAERAAMVCTRQQGKLALGSTVWASVLTMVDDPDTPWGLKVAIEDTVEWRRTDEDMQALVWAMGLSEEQADDLFRLAMTL